jgi:NADP-dependent 3-hydroxy acid dehydrogenase YdfG
VSLRLHRHQCREPKFPSPSRKDWKEAAPSPFACVLATTNASIKKLRRNIMPFLAPTALCYRGDMGSRGRRGQSINATGGVGMRGVVITGTSTGIGWGAAKVLIANGFRVFGSVRKRADADRLKAEFGQSYVPLLFDVTDAGAVKAAAAEVRATLAGETLAGLVNNAGVAVAGPLLELPVEEFRRQIEINLVGVVIVTQAFAPLLGTDRGLKGNPGRIVNIGSVGGRIGNPFLAPYVASKFTLEGLSGEPAARAAAVRHRRHRHRAGCGGDPDLGEG